MSRLYIAYGSNLNKAQMRSRCPTAEYVGSGVIEDYELQFKGSTLGAHATIAPKEGSSVPVGLWKIRPGDEKRLDCYEGFPHYYFKETLPVTVKNHQLLGMAYIMNLRRDFGIPSRSYLETIREGYRDCGLDPAVLKEALQSSYQQALPRLEAQEGMHFG